MTQTSRFALLLPFGLSKEGRMVSPTDTLPGQACDCVCPACGLPLIAINRNPNPRAGEQRPHFRHAVGAMCTSGGETAIHLMAKQILVEARRCWAPKQEVFIRGLQDQTGSLHTIPSRVVPPREFKFSEIAIEAPSECFRPDVTGITSDSQLHIEIRVTHAVSDEKASRVSELRQDMIEIDLSARAGGRAILDVAELTRLVVDSLDNKRWIYCAAAEIVRSTMLEELQQKVRLQNNGLAWAALNYRPTYNRNQQHRINTGIKKLRCQHQWVFDAFEEYIRDRETIGHQNNQLSLLKMVDIPIIHDWIFLSPRSSWQQYIISTYFFAGAEGLLIDIKTARDKVCEIFKIAPAVYMLEQLRTTSHLNWGVDILTAREKSYLPATIIRNYIKSLVDLGHVRRVEENKFQVMKCINS